MYPAQISFYCGIYMDYDFFSKILFSFLTELTNHILLREEVKDLYFKLSDMQVDLF